MRPCISAAGEAAIQLVDAEGSACVPPPLQVERTHPAFGGERFDPPARHLGHCRIVEPDRALEAAHHQLDDGAGQAAHAAVGADHCLAGDLPQPGCVEQRRAFLGEVLPRRQVRLALEIGLQQVAGLTRDRGALRLVEHDADAARPVAGARLGNQRVAVARQQAVDRGAVVGRCAVDIGQAVLGGEQTACPLVLERQRKLLRTDRQRGAKQRQLLLEPRKREDIRVATGQHEMRALLEQDRGQSRPELLCVGRRRRQIGAVAAEDARRICGAVDANDLDAGAAALQRVEDVLADQAADAGDRDLRQCERRSAGKEQSRRTSPTA